MSLEIPLGEQAHLKEFFELAEQRFRDDRLKSYEKLIQYVDSMEQQCADMREEIGYLKEQLQDMEDKSLKSKLESWSVSIQERSFWVGKKIKDIGIAITDQTKEILSEIRKGKNHVQERLFEQLQAKKHLESIRGYLGNLNQTLEVGLKELEQAEKKMEEAKIHRKEAIAILRGKEMKKEKNEGRKEGILRKTLYYMKHLCEGMEQRTMKMIQVIEKVSDIRPEKQKTDWKSKIHPKTVEETFLPERGR